VSRRKGYRAARSGREAELARYGREVMRALREGTDPAIPGAKLDELLNLHAHDDSAWDRLKDTCTTCGQGGHWARDCRNLTCRACNEYGHRASDCPKVDL